MGTLAGGDDGGGGRLGVMRTGCAGTLLVTDRGTGCGRICVCPPLRLCGRTFKISENSSSIGCWRICVGGTIFGCAGTGIAFNCRPFIAMELCVSNIAKICFWFVTISLVLKYQLMSQRSNHNTNSVTTATTTHATRVDVGGSPMKPASSVTNSFNAVIILP